MDSDTYRIREQLCIRPSASLQDVQLFVFKLMLIGQLVHLCRWSVHNNINSCHHAAVHKKGNILPLGSHISMADICCQRLFTVSLYARCTSESENKSQTFMGVGGLYIHCHRGFTEQCCAGNLRCCHIPGKYKSAE